MYFLVELELKRNLRQAQSAASLFSELLVKLVFDMHVCTLCSGSVKGDLLVPSNNLTCQQWVPELFQVLISISHSCSHSKPFESMFLLKGIKLLLLTLKG